MPPLLKGNAMSTMEDTKEIEAWNAYSSRGGMEQDHHEIRSHRAPRVPSAFPIRRILAMLTALTMAAAFLNTEAVTRDSRQPISTQWHAAPMAIMEPQQVPTVDLPTPRIDTGSQIDSDPRDTNPADRASRTEAIRKVLPPPVLAPRIEKVIAYALAQQGKPYKWAAAGPNAFDCSGLVLAAFKQIGINLPHYTGTMINYGKKVSKSQLQRGDIIFPTSGHVAIYLGNGKQVAASSSKHRVVVQPVYGFYAARRLV